MRQLSSSRNRPQGSRSAMNVNCSRSLIDCHSPRGASLPRSPRSLHTKSATPCMRTSSPKSTTPSPNQWILPMGGGPKQVPRARKPQRWAQRSSRVRIIPNGRHGRSPTDSRMRMRTNMWVQWIMRRTNPTRVPILCSMQLGRQRKMTCPPLPMSNRCAGASVQPPPLECSPSTVQTLFHSPSPAHLALPTLLQTSLHRSGHPGNLQHIAVSGYEEPCHFF
mmetsp:Transcript_2992/g.5691  ORF Transcript_2992/g.5691 Transcript_2992/m.5691 type:complete len:221 (+) Transcript_2992:877-1539(+)